MMLKIMFRIFFISCTVIFIQLTELFPNHHCSKQYTHFLILHFFLYLFLDHFLEYYFHSSKYFSAIKFFPNFTLTTLIYFQYHHLRIFHIITNFMFLPWIHRKVTIISSFVLFYLRRVCRNILSIKLFLLDPIPWEPLILVYIVLRTRNFWKVIHLLLRMNLI